jgi:hypothetical protein
MVLVDTHSTQTLLDSGKLLVNKQPNNPYPLLRLDTVRRDDVRHPLRGFAQFVSNLADCEKFILFHFNTFQKS